MAARFLAAALIGVYVYAYHIEPHRLEITRVAWSPPSLAGLTEPILIAQVSDLQTDAPGAWEERVMEALVASKADLVVYTGDYIQIGERGSDREVYLRARQGLRKILEKHRPHPRFGSFAVGGDTETRRPWRTLFDGLDVTMPEDEAVVLELPGVRVNLVGLRAPTSRGLSQSDLIGALEQVEPGLFTIVVGHSPDFVASMDGFEGPFLALAGHTHGGQVRLPFIGPIITFSNLPRRYADAFTPYRNGMLSVSRGLGMERYDAPRLRFLCRPELRLIRLEPGP